MENHTEKSINNWLNGSYDQQTKNEILRMKKEDPRELEESFYTSLEFGTGGLRGLMGIGTNRMNIYTVAMATQGLSNYLNEVFPSEAISVAIAYDNRNNNRLFADTTANVFSANGIKVWMFEDIRPTPELSFAIRQLGCKSGVMITASHNPKEYNGYKAYWEDGAQMIEPHDINVIKNVQKITDAAQVKWERNEDLIELIPSSFDQKFIDNVLSMKQNGELIDKFGDFGIIYTPIHGTGSKIMPEALKQYGFSNVTMVPEQAIADGNFPTVIHPNPEDARALEMSIELGKKLGAELILATDPDADRIAVAVRDSKGEFTPINGNQAAALLSYYLLKIREQRGELKSSDYLVKTIVTTELMAKISEKFGVECFNVLTGFKFIADVIRKNEGKRLFIGGGEESYGYMIGENVRDKDSIASAAMIAEIMAWGRSMGKSILDLLEDIYREFGYFLEDQVALTKKGMDGMAEIGQMMSDYRQTPPQEIASKRVVKVFDYKSLKATDLISGKSEDILLPSSNVLQFLTEDDSIISIRPSGTEPKIKFYFGVSEQLDKSVSIEEVQQKAAQKIEEIKNSLGL